MGFFVTYLVKLPTSRLLARVLGIPFWPLTSELPVNPPETQIEPQVPIRTPSCTPILTKIVCNGIGVFELASEGVESATSRVSD